MLLQQLRNCIESKLMIREKNKQVVSTAAATIMSTRAQNRIRNEDPTRTRKTNHHRQTVLLMDIRYTNNNNKLQAFVISQMVTMVMEYSIPTPHLLSLISFGHNANVYSHGMMRAYKLVVQKILKCGIA